MPKTFGRYELHQLLGRGGMGEVYRAYDTQREREVALKLLPRHLASDEAFQARFRRESRLAAKLSDPHIIPIHDFGEIDGQLFLDMRLVKGQDLSAVLETNGRLPTGTAVGILGQIAAALDSAHASGLVHRDVKPSNVLLTGMSGHARDLADANLFAYLVDFGIARSQSHEGTALTAATSTLGTVAYLAPERMAADGSPGDHRSDVYALACVLYELLTGKKPYDGEMFAIMYGHMNVPVPRVSDSVPDCPRGMDDVVARGMAKNPDERYASAGELARAARSVLRSAPARGASPRGAPAPPPSRPYAPPPDPAPASRPSSGPPAPPAPPLRPPTLPDARPAGPGRSPTAPSRSRRRTAMLAGLAALVVLAGGIVAVVALTGSDGSPQAGGSTGRSAAPSTKDFPNGTGGAPKLTAASGSSVSWDHFASFTALLGTDDHDTAHAFKNADCTLGRAESGEAKDGVVERVRCRLGDTGVAMQVSRFSNADKIRTLLDSFGTDGSYGISAWTQQDAQVGLSYAAPNSTDSADIRTTVCGLPTYLVSFYADPTATTKVGQSALKSTYWDAATFPDLVPPQCNDDFSGPATGASASKGITADKSSAVLSGTAVTRLVTGGSADVGSKTVATKSGSDSIVYGSTGTVAFWSYSTSTHVVARTDASSYPYSASVGPAKAKVSAAAVLTGMAHASFVLTGNFTGDGSGNAVVFADGPKGWGVIKAKSDGDLAPSGTTVGSNKIGLGYGFDLDAGKLVTTDCSQQVSVADCGSAKNRIIKVWKWTGSAFELVSRKGPSR